MSDAPHTPRLPLAARLKGAIANPGVLLAAFSLATALILAGSDELTSAAIATRATEDLYASLSQVVPDGLHDNDLTADTRVIADAVEGEVPVYLATAGGTLTAVAFGGPVWIFFLVVVVWGASISPDSAQFSALVADNSPGHQAGSLMTLQTALGFAMTFFTVQATPVLAEWWGWPPVIAIMALGPAFGIYAMARLTATS